MRLVTALRAAHAEERGNNTVLGIGYIVLLLLLIAVVVFVTEVNIAARQLWATTDSAALAAADVGGTAPEASEVPDTPKGQEDLTVDPAQLRSRVDEFLALSGAYQRHRGLRVESVRLDEHQQTVEVMLSAEAAGPILHALLPAGVPVSTESSARLVLTR